MATTEIVNTGDFEITSVPKEVCRVYDLIADAQRDYEMASDCALAAEGVFKFPFWAVLLGLPLWCIPSIIMIVLNQTVFKKKRVALEEEALNYLNSADGKMARIITPIPKKYLFLTCLEYAKELAATGRANTAPELYDRLDEQLHRWTVEAANNRILSTQLALNERMGQISSTSSIAAAASVLNLFR